VVTEEKTKSARTKAREWAQEQVRDANELELKELAHAGVAAMRRDAKWFDAFLNESAYQMMYEVLQDVVSKSRDRDFVLYGDKAATRAAITKKASEHSVFKRWMAHIGDRHKLLMEMNRPELLLSAKEDFDRGGQQVVNGRLKTRLAAKMLDDETPVEEVWEIADIERLDEEVIDEVRKTLTKLGEPI